MTQVIIDTRKFLENLLDRGGDGEYDSRLMDDLIAILRRKVEFHRQQAKAYELALQAALNEAPAPASTSPKKREKKTNKTEVVRRMIQERGTEGISPAEIREHSEQLGLKFPVNYPYTILGKLVGRGQIRKELGKYYPVMEQ